MYADYTHGGMSIVNSAIKIGALHVKHIYNLLQRCEAKWCDMLSLKRTINPSLTSLASPRTFTRPAFYYDALFKFADVLRAAPDLG